MFLFKRVCASKMIRFPRIRGDVPRHMGTPTRNDRFSPHTRGCSSSPHQFRGTRRVFPAYAGMFRFDRPGHDRCDGFPRIRGDVPGVKNAVDRVKTFSPHTRGCSGRFGTFGRQNHVFPAYAGMFRSSPADNNKKSCFPRIRGDVPPTCKCATARDLFSPHTRGCSGVRFEYVRLINVFPAYAGMFLIIS